MSVNITDDDAPQFPLNDGDTAWLLMSTALVMLMTPGLAFFYGGLVRRNNVVNTLMMSFICLALVSMHWVIFGYSFAFGPGSSMYGNEKFIGMQGVGREPNPVYAPTIPHSLFCVYQMMFAAITPAIISGSVVERMKFSTFLIFVFCWTTVVYDCVAHWIWAAWYEVEDGEVVTKFGWLRELGSLDFAGGAAVHISSGVSAMIAGMLLPKREVASKKPANVGFVLLGTALLWFGWFGFNGGSALAGDGLASEAIITTQTAAATGFFTWTLLDLIVKRVVKPGGAACGAVIGLVAITPAAGFVHIPSALAFGVIPVLLIYSWLILRTRYLSEFFPGEDTLDVFAAHGLGGIIGCILVGFFASKDVNPLGADGVFFGGKGWLLAYQITAIVSVTAYSAVVTFIILMFLKCTIGLTYSSEMLAKIDLHQHGTNLTNSQMPNKTLPDEVINMGELTRDSNAAKKKNKKHKKEIRVEKEELEEEGSEMEIEVDGEMVPENVFRGERGFSGEKGFKGEKGFNGVKGANGFREEPGSRGENGSGSKREYGSMGEYGSNGEHGSKREHGSRREHDGSKGENGSNGSNGFRRDNGSKAENGFGEHHGSTGEIALNGERKFL